MKAMKSEDKYVSYKLGVRVTVRVLDWDLGKNTRSANTTRGVQSPIGGETWDKTVTICVCICHYQIAAEKNCEQIESHCICIRQFLGDDKNRQKDQVDMTKC